MFFPNLLLNQVLLKNNISHRSSTTLHSNRTEEPHTNFSHQRELFSKLKEGGYISADMTFQQFLGVSGN